MSWSLCISDAGYVYVAGTYTSSCSIGTSSLVHATTNTTTDIFVAKFDSSLSPVWATGFGGNRADDVYGISVTSDSQIFVTGMYESDTMLIGANMLLNLSGGTQMYIYLAKFSAPGAPLWSKSLAADTFYTYVAGCTTDSWGNVYLCGAYYGNFSFGPYVLPTLAGINPGAFLGKYDSVGNAKWVRVVPDSDVRGVGMVKADKCGNVWIYGNGGPYPDITLPYNPMFLAHYDTAGNFVDSVFLLQGGDDGSSITLDNNGYLYLCSDYGYAFNFKLGSDSVKVMDSTYQAMYIAKYQYQYPNCTPISTPGHDAIGETRKMVPDILIYPNPAAFEVVIRFTTNPGHSATADLFDLTGTLRQSYALSGSESAVSVSGYPPGVYQLRIYTAGSAATTRMLVIIK